MATAAVTPERVYAEFRMAFVDKPHVRLFVRDGRGFNGLTVVARSERDRTRECGYNIGRHLMFEPAFERWGCRALAEEFCRFVGESGW